MIVMVIVMVMHGDGDCDGVGGNCKGGGDVY